MPKDLLLVISKELHIMQTGFLENVFENFSRFDKTTITSLINNLSSIVIVMWGGKYARQQRPYDTIGVIGLGSRIG